MMIVPFLFLSLMFWLLYRVRMSKVSSIEEARELFLPGLFIGGFMALTLPFSLMGLASLARFSEVPVTTRFAEIKGMKGDVVVEGTVSEKNPVRQDDYVAYFRHENSEDGSTDRDTPGLTITLADSSIAVDNNTYNAMNWRSKDEAFHSYSFLKAGDPVVVAGEVSRGVTFSGERVLAIRASVICRGRFADFVRCTRAQSVIPSVLSAIAASGSLLGSLAIVFLTVRMRLRARNLPHRT